MNNDAALALGTVALVPAVFGAMLPPLATVRAEPNDAHRRAAVASASLIAAGVVAGVAVATRSSAPVLAGGIVVAVFAGLYTRALDV